MKVGCKRAKDRERKRGVVRKTDDLSDLLYRPLEHKLERLTCEQIAAALGAHRSTGHKYKRDRWDHVDETGHLDDDQLELAIDRWLREEVRDLSNEREPLQERLPQQALSV